MEGGNPTLKNKKLEEYTLQINILLSRIPLVGPLFFKIYKMNEIVNKLLSAGETFMYEMHLRQPKFIYSACGPFTKNKERIQKFRRFTIYSSK